MAKTTRPTDDDIDPDRLREKMQAAGEVVKYVIKDSLYHLWRMFEGKDEYSKFPFRMTAEQFEEARPALVTLYEISKRLGLEPNPRAVALSEAKADRAFQTFLGKATARIARATAKKKKGEAASPPRAPAR
jgi:hypothetical protein